MKTGDYIREFRKERGWSQSTLKKEFGIHISTLVRWESKDKLDRVTELALEGLAIHHPPKKDADQVSA